MAPSTLGKCRAISALLTAAALSTTASAFQSTSTITTTSSSNTPTYARHNVLRFMSQYYEPSYYDNPYHYPNPPPQYNPYQQQLQQQRQPHFYREHHHHHFHPVQHQQQQQQRSHPRYSVCLDAEVISDADDLLNEQEQVLITNGDEQQMINAEDEEWISDKQRAQEQSRERDHGTVINSYPEEQGQATRPLKSAAAYPSDIYDDDNQFMGRKPGQPVNRSNNGGGDNRVVSEPTPGADSIMGESTDPREQHVILDDYEEYNMMNNDFFQPPRPPQNQPPPVRRQGPAVYTSEEEELISAMGGRNRPTTQEFAGLGTMTNNKGGMPNNNNNMMPQNNEMPIDPQQQNYNPEEYYNPAGPAGNEGPHFMPPQMPMPPPTTMAGANQEFRQEGYLGDSTLREISLDYSIPIPYLADVLANWGVPVPIDPHGRLGDMVTGEQAFSVLEAIHTLDIASLHARYSEEDLINICGYYDMDVKDAFEFCVGRGWVLPFGVRTFLRVEQEEELLDALG